MGFPFTIVGSGEVVPVRRHRTMLQYEDRVIARFVAAPLPMRAMKGSSKNITLQRSDQQIRNLIDRSQHHYEHYFTVWHHSITTIGSMAFASMIPRVAIRANTKKLTGTTLVRVLCKCRREIHVVG